MTGRKEQRQAANKYLKQVKKLEIKWKEKQEELETLRTYTSSVAAVNYQKERIQATKKVDTLEENIIRCEQLEEQVNNMFNRYFDTRKKITDEIQELENEKHIELLFKWYVQGKKIEQIADEMGYSEYYIKELKGKALDEFQKLYKIPAS